MSAKMCAMVKCVNWVFKYANITNRTKKDNWEKFFALASQSQVKKDILAKRRNYPLNET